MEREGYGIQKGRDVYGKSMAMPDGTVIKLFPAEGFDFNPGKEGLAKAGLV
jgi:hypothetical protein